MCGNPPGTVIENSMTIRARNMSLDVTEQPTII
jgi:hypothetical protein